MSYYNLFWSCSSARQVFINCPEPVAAVWKLLRYIYGTGCYYSEVIILCSRMWSLVTALKIKITLSRVDIVPLQVNETTASPHPLQERKVSLLFKDSISGPRRQPIGSFHVAPQLMGKDRGDLRRFYVSLSVARENKESTHVSQVPGQCKPPPQH